MRRQQRRALLRRNPELVEIKSQAALMVKALRLLFLPNGFAMKGIEVMRAKAVFQGFGHAAQMPEDVASLAALLSAQVRALRVREQLGHRHRQTCASEHTVRISMEKGCSDKVSYIFVIY